jgi:hypothetical protein
MFALCPECVRTVSMLFSVYAQNSSAAAEAFWAYTMSSRTGSGKGGCRHGTWWIIRPALYRPTSGRFMVMRQSQQAISLWSEALSELFCGYHHPSAHDMILHPHLTSMPLKRKPVARGKRAPRVPSVWITNIMTALSIPHRIQANQQF